MPNSRPRAWGPKLTSADSGTESSEVPQHSNSFTALRILAALGVLFGHHYSLDGQLTPVLPGIGHSVSTISVHAFFAISGFLIYQSLARKASPAHFFAARLLRLMPALLVSLVVVSATMLVAFDNYENLAAHVDYVRINSLMFLNGVAYTIPGVLTDRPLAGPNGSLWTLPHEFWLYVLLFLISQLRPALRDAFIVASLVGIAFLTTIDLSKANIGFAGLVPALGAGQFVSLAIYFAAGATIACSWPLIEQRRWVITVALLVAAVLLSGSGAFPLAWAAAFSLFIIALGSSKLLVAVKEWGDPSYGIYIYAFPVQQLCLIYIPGFWTSMLAAIVITATLGYLSWHVLEERALRHRKHLAALLRWPFRTQDAQPIATSAGLTGEKATADASLAQAWRPM